MNATPSRKPRSGRGRKASKAARQRHAEPPQRRSVPACGSRSAKVRDLIRPAEITLALATRDPTAHLRAARRREDLHGELLATETPEYFFRLARKEEHEEREAAARRPRFVPPPPSILNAVEGLRYRTIVMGMVKAGAPGLHADLLGLLALFLGDHTPGEGNPAPSLPAPLPPPVPYRDDDYGLDEYYGHYDDRDDDGRRNRRGDGRGDWRGDPQDDGLDDFYDREY